MKIDKKHLLDYSIFIPYMILSVLGLIVVYSTTSANLVQFGANTFKSVVNQGVFWIVSLVIIALVYKMKLNVLRNGKLIAGAIGVEILLLLIARVFGTETNGAKGWLYLGSFSMQPAEYLKVLIVWFLAYDFARKEDRIAQEDYLALTKPTTITHSIVRIG